MRARLYIGLILITLLSNIRAGDTLAYINRANMLKVKIVDGDTVLYTEIREVTFYGPRQFKSKADYRRYQKLIRNVKKAYPYAKLAKKKLNEVNTNMLALKTEAQRKTYMKQVEKEVRDEFEDELKKLTITQGRILIKLIDRETGNTSYELVKDLRGNFSAIFWQTLARLFGSSLKTEFDAEGEDKLINEIVIMIENGQL